MKKWIIMLGVLVGLIILLLIQSDGRKILHTETTRSPGPNADGLSAKFKKADRLTLFLNFSPVKFRNKVSYANQIF